MVRALRPRHYVPRVVLWLVRPFFRYSPSRDAYVLRAIGGARGPVLRKDRRRGQREFPGSERRGVLLG